MDSSSDIDVSVEKDQLILHFSHEHPLDLLYLQQNHKNKNDDDEDEDEEEHEDDFVEEDNHGGQCNMCKEHIWSFHICYYYCKSCDYSLHTYCAELPMTLQNHPSHPNHNLTLRNESQPSIGNAYFYQPTAFEWKCYVCNRLWNNIYSYGCSICNIYMDIICATKSKQKINNPSHPHQLERMNGHIVSDCVACGDKHEGVFFQCTTCSMFRINMECALLPAKLLIQNHTKGTFTHSHPLALAYSFAPLDIQAKYFPYCKVCHKRFYPHLWIYKCDKCRYYVHVGCATSKTEPFMSIFMTAGLGKTSKNFKEHEHPNLLHCPFDDVGDNLLRRHTSNKNGEQHDGEMLNHSSHQHPLILFNKQTSLDKKLISLHNPIKRTQLLCDGCVKPITTVPFYKCSEYVDEQCCFVLHVWCAKLPSHVKDYVSHPQHTLFLLPKVPSNFFGVFYCGMCALQSNGFAYGCTECKFYIDINCAFIPEEITHDFHPNHLLHKVERSSYERPLKYCKACNWSIIWGFHCPTCDFYIHVNCALLLTRVIKHKCDKHPLSLRYEPVENHINEYFCEICEDEFDPWLWFYHCTTCAQSMHTACVPLILQCEQATHALYRKAVYEFLNIKFGRTLKIKGHSHHLTFVQGLESDGECIQCSDHLQYKMIFKCLECDFAFHYECASSFVNFDPV